MLTDIDGKLYNVNLDKLSKDLLEWYETNKNTVDTIYLDNGRTMDFSRKSIARVAFKALMVPVITSVVNMLYRSKELQPPKKDKHEDLLDYAAISLLGFIGKLDQEIVYVESLAIYQSDIRGVTTLSTVIPEYRRLGQSTQHSENTEICTGRETRVHCWAVGDGQDLPYKIADKEEATDSTLA